ncbi:hypothetical protein DXG01_010999, partial [Tephrocybe rancida]
LPPHLPHTASCKELHNKNNKLQAKLEEARVQLQKDYVQMQDTKNEWLHKWAFVKAEKKGKKKLTSSHPRHLASDKMLSTLEREEWEGKWKKLLKQATPQLKQIAKEIDDFCKNIEREARQQVIEAEKGVRFPWSQTPMMLKVSHQPHVPNHNPFKSTGSSPDVDVDVQINKPVIEEPKVAKNVPVERRKT